MPVCRKVVEAVEAMEFSFELITEMLERENYQTDTQEHYIDEINEIIADNFFELL